MKKVYVVLAFHAHEPLWDFPGQVQALADREEIRSGVTAINYLHKRKEEGATFTWICWPWAGG